MRATADRLGESGARALVEEGEGMRVLRPVWITVACVSVLLGAAPDAVAVPARNAQPVRPVVAIVSAGTNSCQPDITIACPGASAVIGDNSCNGTNACTDLTGNVGNNSCNGDYACSTFVGNVGNNSCNGFEACQDTALVNVPDNTCNGDSACTTRVVRYVTVTGAGAMDGSSWSNAFAGLYNALSVATQTTDLWVAAGTYLPGDSLDRNSHFGVNPRIKVFGGFAGNETNLFQRDWVAHPTILSGDIGVSGVRADNACQVVKTVDHVLLDGLTITGGNADDFSGDCSDEDGYGAGILNHGAPLTLRNVTIAGNSATSDGGGIDTEHNTSLLIIDSTITGNSADRGGGLSIVETTASLYNVTISGNSANEGGGLYLTASSLVLFDNSILWGNSPQSVEGGLVLASHSIIGGGLDSHFSDGGGNLSSDPLFVAPVAASSAPTTAGDYHLQSGSPAFNAGRNALVPADLLKDIDGDPRILSGTVEMGSDEIRTACAPGYWSATGDDRTGGCAAADAGHYVNTTGATGQTPCELGRYQPNTGQTGCVPADVGYFVDTTGSDHQAACPAGQTTSSIASTSAAACFTLPLSPYQKKQHASASLKALVPTGSRPSNRLLRKATFRIDRSLASWRWIGQDALNPLNGFRVFNNERKAVFFLSRPRFSGDSTVIEAINELVSADREIAVKAIGASSDPAAISRANMHLATADARTAMGHYGRAIKALKQAWLAVV